MKTFKQFLESDSADDKYHVNPVSVSDLEAIAEKIQNESSIMVEAFSNCDRALLRGIQEHKDKTAPLVGHAHIRQDRRPIFMDMEYHKILNNAFSDLNLPTRGNSLFATTSKESADDWGKTSIVFIKNGWTGLIFEELGPDEYAFDFLWEKVHDLRNGPKSDSEMHEELKLFIASLKPNKFNSTDGLEKVLKEGYRDILIQGTEYYSLSLDTVYRKTTKLILENLDIFTLKNVDGYH